MVIVTRPRQSARSGGDTNSRGRSGILMVAVGGIKDRIDNVQGN